MTETWTIREILQWCTNYLKEKSPTARLDSELIICDALQCDRIYIYCHNDKPLNLTERATVKSHLKRRSRGEPIAYILGHKEFYGRKYQVNPNVLIPRPETEHLVEEATKYARSHFAEEPLRLLEVGSGSGCLAISMKLEVPNAAVDSWDISEEALQVARTNGAQLDAEIAWNCYDALDRMVWERHPGSFDIICSNPPYIAHSESSEMSNSVLDFEPHKALFAPQNGLAFYESIAKFGKSALKQGGVAFVEIGAGQGTTVPEIFDLHGWSEIKVLTDLAKLPRVVQART